MIIQKQKSYKIDYIKANGENTTREILALTEAPKNISALDLTDLNELQKVYLISKQKEYSAYVENYMKSLFDFATWYEHTMGTELPDILKFRTFTVDNIECAETLDY